MKAGYYGTGFHFVIPMSQSKCGYTSYFRSYFRSYVMS